ncbi:MAG TPA: sugar phosphate isomerase/epimerase family protein [Gemmataceae bacterium]|jgi:D-psicose/D-tagatose/L-ribulose 3-epimerase|nr:sugar phosphate isomerase/epimerase family protein [Gemmataceae bacterium]
MKTGMNLLLWATHVTADHFPILAKLKKTGFDGVEIPIFEGDVEHYQKIRKELDNQGLACTTVGLMTPEANPIAPDPALRQAAVERFKRLIDWTATLKAELMAGPFHSPLGVFSGAGPTEDEKKRGADVLRQAAEMAQKAGIKLAIEYLNRFECYFLTTAADARALVKRVNHPNFRMMYDTFHANIEEKNISEAIAGCADSFIHVHISENDRGTPGTGHVHWDETFKALRKAKYDNWLVIESFGRALPDLAAATKVWRDLFPAAEEVYTQGLRFMRDKWAATAP